MTNKEAIEWLEKEIKFRHNLKVSPLLAGKQDTEEEVYRAAVEALKFQEEYVTKVQKCIDRIESLQDIPGHDLLTVQQCIEIVKEEMGCQNETN